MIHKFHLSAPTNEVVLLQVWWLLLIHIVGSCFKLLYLLFVGADKQATTVPCIKHACVGS